MYWYFFKREKTDGKKSRDTVPFNENASKIVRPYPGLFLFVIPDALSSRKLILRSRFYYTAGRYYCFLCLMSQKCEGKESENRGKKTFVTYLKGIVSRDWGGLLMVSIDR
jgi:hypothetical protein